MQLHSHQSYLILTISSQLHRSPPHLTKTLVLSLFHCMLWCVGQASSHGDLHNEDISAVQRALLDRFSNHRAQKSDDRTRVVAAYHSAAWYYHVGSCLEQIWTYSTHNVRENRKIHYLGIAIVLMYAFLTSAHLWIVSGPTPPSTSMSNEGNWLRSQLTWLHTQKISSKPAQHYFQILALK